MTNKNEKPVREKVQAYFDAPEVNAVEIETMMGDEILRFAYMSKADNTHVQLTMYRPKSREEGMPLNSMGTHIAILTDAHLGHLIDGLQKLRTRLKKSTCECGKKHE